jgi:prepilin-type N-terminal cleavage/methylation domain-containing protein
MRHNKKAFTLVEMLVALAVSAVIISATYASFELIKNQYKRNTDISQLHSSGRAIMQVLEREIRMAGYEFRDGNGVMTYGKILEPLVITDSGDSCCDEVTIVYDEVDDTLNAQGVVTSSQVQRIQTRFWTEAFTSNKRGDRFRLFKRRTILGQNNALLPRPTVRPREVMADYIEDLQLNYVTNARLYAGFNGAKVIQIINPSTGAITGTIANTSQASALAFLVNKMGNGTLININIALRSREGYGRNRAVNKQTYHAGNFNFIRNDQFQRDVFESTVAVRNL